MNSTRSDVKREASLNSNYGSSDEDHSQTGDVIDEDAIVAASADFRNLVDDIRTMACVENSKPWSSSENASNWSLGAHISRRPDLQVVAASADFQEVVDDVPRLGQPAPEPAKSLIVKLPVKKTMKSESSDPKRNDLDHLTTVASGPFADPVLLPLTPIQVLIFLCRTIAMIHWKTRSMIPLNSCQLGMALGMGCQIPVYMGV